MSTQFSVFHSLPQLLHTYGCSIIDRMAYIPKWQTNGATYRQVKKRSTSKATPTPRKHYILWWNTQNPDLQKKSDNSKLVHIFLNKKRCSNWQIFRGHLNIAKIVDGSKAFNPLPPIGQDSNSRHTLTFANWQVLRQQSHNPLLVVSAQFHLNQHGRHTKDK